MTAFTEGDLKIVFDGAVRASKFDEPSIHGLSNCMKAVDFVVELEKNYLFIEFKDPQKPGVLARDLQEFRKSFGSGVLDENLKYKYRDSFLYEWASNRANKPIDYLVLIALDSLDKPTLLHRTEALKKKLPILGPGSDDWSRPFVRNCMVFNLAAWNNHFPQFPVARVSESQN